MEFPKRDIETAIRDEIAQAANDRPPTKSGAPRPEVDSLVVVLVQIRVKEEFGIELPNNAIPAGGFDDVEHCVQNILEESRLPWREKHRQQGETVS